MTEFTKEELYKLAEEHDIKVDKRWNLEKLHETVEAALVEKHGVKTTTTSTDEPVEMTEEAPEETVGEEVPEAAEEKAPVEELEETPEPAEEEAAPEAKEAADEEATEPLEDTGPQEVEVLSRLEWNHKVHLKGDKAKLPKELATLLISQGVVK